MTALNRALLHPRDAGRRAHDEYLSRRGAGNLFPADIDETAVASAAIIYLEGYLWDPPHAKEAFVKAAGIAHEAGRKVALTLSDAFCVDRYRDEFLELMRDKTVDIVFANESELRSLYQTADFETALKSLRGDIGSAIVTRSEKGCVVVQGKTTERVPAAPIARWSTHRRRRSVRGRLSGRLFARQGSRVSAQLGALAAAEVIQHVGARPETPLKALAEGSGLGFELFAMRAGNRIGNRTWLPLGKIAHRGVPVMAEPNETADSGKTVAPESKTELPNVELPPLSPAENLKEPVPEAQLLATPTPQPQPQPIPQSMWRREAARGDAEGQSPPLKIPQVRMPRSDCRAQNSLAGFVTVPRSRRPSCWRRALAPRWRDRQCAPPSCAATTGRGAERGSALQRSVAAHKGYRRAESQCRDGVARRAREPHARSPG